MDYRSDAEICAEERADQLGEQPYERRGEEKVWSSSMWFGGIIIVIVALGVCWYAFKRTDMNNSPSIPVTVETTSKQVLPVLAGTPGTTGSIDASRGTREIGMSGNSRVAGTQGSSETTGATGATGASAFSVRSEPNEQ